MEGIIRGLAKDQKPMLEFLVGLAEQDWDEDLAGLAQHTKGSSSVNCVDLMNMEKLRDREAA